MFATRHVFHGSLVIHRKPIRMLNAVGVGRHEPRCATAGPLASARTGRRRRWRHPSCQRL